jgi:hypothetical protein
VSALAAVEDPPPAAPLPVGIHALIPKIIGSLPAIGKDQQMSGGGGPSYKFRGVEDVMKALKPLLAEHGVHWSAVKIMTVADSEFTVRSGSVWQRTRMTVLFRVYGPDGSFIEHESRGEGTDMGDKASNKAMTAAAKYMLLQVFNVCDAGAEDPDHERQEEQAPAAPAPARVSVAGLKGALAAAVGTERASEFYAKHCTATESENGWVQQAADGFLETAKAWSANLDRNPPPDEEPF